MSKYRRDEATVGDALKVARDLREEDIREVKGLGMSPMDLPFFIACSTHSVAFYDVDGTPGGVAGIQDDPNNPEAGIVWMLCTQAVARKPHTFVREAKRWLAEPRGYKYLWNLADCRNDFHHKLLRLLGFRALRVVNTSPYFLPYYEIVKLCASQ
jgi:hypothetical protein